MTDERDPQVSAAYRELGAEEPPRALDEAILAASRKATRPWTQRYAVPLGLAAVLVLSVTVTLRMQHEQPGIESPTAAKEIVAAAPAQETPLRLKADAQIRPAAEPPARQRAEARKEQAEPKPFASQAPAAPAPASADMLASRADAGRNLESSVTGSLARQAEERTSRDAEAAARAPQVGPLRALAKSSVEAPEPELERIAQLRREGKHDEADKALAEFRKRFPDYRMSEAMRERVERR